MKERNCIVRFELKSLLEKRNLTQEQFGLMCKPPLSREQVSRLTRSTKITFNMLERIIDAFELDSEEVGELIKVYSINDYSSE
ncbi:helix-turn-helix transcriptional regulator [Bacillus gobiensis]|uniref:helix-turn-helix domain-containing protein n=1 Tax=Bacillus gobiensis TaxID=1441095 RepID=UPI003D1E6A84